MKPNTSQQIKKRMEALEKMQMELREAYREIYTAKRKTNACVSLEPKCRLELL